MKTSTETLQRQTEGVPVKFSTETVYGGKGVS